MREAIFLSICTASVVIILCAAAVLKRSSQEKQTADAEWTEPETEPVQCSCKGTKAKRKLMRLFCWSSAASLKKEPQPQPQPQPPLPLGKDKGQNVAAPVWQRPILMGEKCELPRFSGLILYDERGQPLRDPQQEIRSPFVRTTLRDLL